MSETRDSSVGAAIGRVHTACRGCCFAVVEGRTQSGCRLGRVDAFLGQDPASVVEAYDADGNEFFVINRVCNAKRDADWAAAHGPGDVAAVRREVRLRASAVVLACDRPGLRQTVAALVAQRVPPTDFFFVVPPGGPVSDREVHSDMWEALGNAWTWRIVRGVDPGATEAELADAGVNASSGNWYAYFRAGEPVPPEAFAELDRALNERMERVMWRRDGGLFVQRAAHDFVGGNAAAEVAGVRAEWVPAKLAALAEAAG